MFYKEMEAKNISEDVLEIIKINGEILNLSPKKSLKFSYCDNDIISYNSSLEIKETGKVLSLNGNLLVTYKKDVVSDIITVEDGVDLKKLISDTFNDMDETTTETKAEKEAKKEAEVKAEKEAEEKAEKEAEVKAEKEAEVKAEKEAEVKAEKEAEVKAKKEAEVKAKKEAEAKAKKEAEVKTKKEAEVKTKKTK